MICSKCTHWAQPEIKVRMTPTFYHSPIFDEYHPNNAKPIRCTATFHSTVFDNSHHHFRPTKPSCCCKSPKKSETARNIKTSHQSKMRKQMDLYPHTHLSKR